MVSPFSFFRYYLFILLPVASLLFGFFTGCGGSTSNQSNSTKEDPGENTLSFVYQTEEAGLDAFSHENGAFGKKWFPEPFGSGCGFFDYDGDSWLDIVLVGGGIWPQDTTRKPVPALWLYRNNGDGTFALKNEKAGLSDVFAYGTGVCAADYDNDGDQDLFFTTLYENMLFRNDNGVFFEVGKEAGLANQSTLSSSAMFFDANRDGWLDLFVGNYIDWSPEKDHFCPHKGGRKGYCTPAVYDGVPSRFYQNNGDGTFTDLTEAAGFLPSPGKTLGIIQVDYNKDGWADIIVSNDTERHLLYENNGDGSFHERGIQSGLAFDERGTTRAGMGIDAGYIDGSDNLSVFIGHFQDEMIGVYQHVGKGQFLDRAAISGVGRSSYGILTFGLFLFDVDCDQDLDLFCANGHIYIDMESEETGTQFRQKPYLYLNRGDGTFDLLTESIGSLLSQRIVARGAVYGDYDRDGDLDIMISENAGPVHLWRNDSTRGNFLRVKLTGRKSNRDGIGAVIRIKVRDYQMKQRLRTGASYLSQSELVVTFGLGGAARVDSLQVTWPSGLVDSFTDIFVNQEIKIVEGTKMFIQEPLNIQMSLSKR